MRKAVFVACVSTICILSAESRPGGYILGSDDQVTVTAMDLAEIGTTPFRIDLQGMINLPLIGRIHAGGLTVSELEVRVAERLRKYVHDPQVTIAIAEFRSQPVSVLGCVNKPGIHQLQGRKTLFEVLSLAEGLRSDAGNTVKLTRQMLWGAIPLPNAVVDQQQGFSVAEIAVSSIMQASNPKENIRVMPNDVISVPRASVVYVVGSVRKAGGFVLGEKHGVSALQALALAEGLERGAAPGNAKIFRSSDANGHRAEVAVDLKKILAGKGQDLPMYADDILFIPNSASKAAGYRALETAIQLGTGIVIWRR